MNNLYRAFIKIRETRLEALPIGSALEEGGIKVEKRQFTNGVGYEMFIVDEYGEMERFMTSLSAESIECMVWKLTKFTRSKEFYEVKIDNSPEMETLRKENFELEGDTEDESEDDE